MEDDYPRDRPHLFLVNNGANEPYQRPGLRIEPRPPRARDRFAHAAALEHAIGQALVAAREKAVLRDPAIAGGRPGYYLEFELPYQERDVVDKLSNRRQHVEVVAVRTTSPADPVFASVFVPTTAENYFLRKVEAYRTQETRAGRPQNEPLVTSIDTVRVATVRSLFTDEERYFPRDTDELIFWEVWLRSDQREAFERVASALHIQVKQHAVHFPEREVVLALSDAATLERLMANSDSIAELRRAKDTPALFMGMDGGQQHVWADELLDRLTPPGRTNVAVCLLDSGVRQGHPMLAPALSVDDCHTINPAWGTDDAQDWRGHGTAMAGLALYGDLVPVLGSQQPVELSHCLESVRILPPMAAQPNDPELYGFITAEAISRAEIQAAARRRVIAMAVTSNAGNGRPSSWSAAIDQLCVEDGNHRLVILSAGNLGDPVAPGEYLDRNDLEGAEDPAQAWNALTIGAVTEKNTITDPDLQQFVPLAPLGELSPRSRTAVAWDRQWPVKPDVVFEGGNLAYDGTHPADAIDDLQLLTTFYRPDVRPFTTLGDTSAATALAARMAAAILATKPELWPETVRALIVHSAEWTTAMRNHIAACNGARRQMENIVRRYGYGVPDLERALRSTRNDLSLIVEDSLQPFQHEEGEAVRLRDMKLHRLPWPREQLQALGPAQVELRATLSYFIEPNPGERGWMRRHRYASHGLRFRMKSGTETLNEFRARINQAARAEEEGVATRTAAEEWMLGTFRDHGSIHSDFWHGSAAELAERDAIAVFPIGGWWKEKPYLERSNQVARYALVVTIRAPGSDIDIYTPVVAQIAIPTEITV